VMIIITVEYNLLLYMFAEIVFSAGRARWFLEFAGLCAGDSAREKVGDFSARAHRCPGGVFNRCIILSARNSMGPKNPENLRAYRPKCLRGCFSPKT